MENKQISQMPQQEKPKQNFGCLKIFGLTFLFFAAIFVFLNFFEGSIDTSSSSPSPSVTSPSVTTMPQESESEYKESCDEVQYDEIIRDPDGLKGTRVSFSGEILQASDDTYRLQVDDSIIADDVVMFEYRLPDGADRILEGDKVVIWGESKGLYTYKAVLGNEITVPKIKVKYLESIVLDSIELNQKFAIENWNVNVVSVYKEHFANENTDTLYFVIEATNASEREQYLSLQEGYCDGFKTEVDYISDDFKGEKNLLIESVAVGKSIRGYAAFKVNSDWKEFELKIDDGSFVVSNESFASEETEE